MVPIDTPIGNRTALVPSAVAFPDPAEFVPVTMQVMVLPISAVTVVYVSVVAPGPVALDDPDFHWYAYDVGADTRQRGQPASDKPPLMTPYVVGPYVTLPIPPV